MALSNCLRHLAIDLEQVWDAAIYMHGIDLRSIERRSRKRLNSRSGQSQVDKSQIDGLEAIS